MSHVTPPELTDALSKSSINLADLKLLKRDKGALSIYISGPMSGYDKMNYPAFFRVEELIKEAGHIPINPARNPAGLSYVQYMKLALSDLCISQAVVRLENWQHFHFL